MDITSLVDGSYIALFFKILMLSLLLLFTIYTFILYNHTKSLNKIVLVQDIAGTKLIKLLSLFFLLASASLFLLSLVIL